MPLTYEERVEVLKKARAIKAEKALAKKAENNETPKETPKETKVTPKETQETPETPKEVVKKAKIPRNRKKYVTPTKSLTIEESEPKTMKQEPEEIITEEITEIRKKPKKKVVKKIIYESNSEDEIIEEVEVTPVTKVTPVKEKKPKPVKQQSEETKFNPFFNY